MYTANFVKSVLKSKIDKNILKFVIYPYGDNGFLVKQILQEYFSNTSYLTIDNQYCKYQADIISLEELKMQYDKSMYIILTIEDKQLNSSMYRELLNFAPKANIINLLQIQKDAAIEYVVSNPSFSFRHICPDIDLPAYRPQFSKSKIKKVVFIPQGYPLWNSEESICNAFLEDKNYDVKIIIMDTVHQYSFIEKLERKSIPYVSEHEYKAQEERPDIVIVSYYNAQLSNNMINNMRFFKYVIALSAVLVNYYGNKQELFEFNFANLYRFHPKFYIADTIIYNEMRGHPLIGDKLIELGNPKFDGIYRGIIEKTYDDNNSKLKGKKVFAWITTHGVNRGRFSLFVTFDLYAKVILDFVKENLNVGLIIRLHHLFIYELFESGVWNYEEVESFKEYCRLSPNIVWDETETYDNTLGIADAFIMDGFCGTICSALPTLKPICTLYRNDRNIEPIHPELVENYYQAYSDKDVISFMEMVKNGKDPMYEKRRNASRKFIKSFKGDNGLQIKKFIENNQEL